MSSVTFMTNFYQDQFLYLRVHALTKEEGFIFIALSNKVEPGTSATTPSCRAFHARSRIGSKRDGFELNDSS